MKRGTVSDQIVKAFTTNLKEQKKLQKTIQAIGTEENYTLKLIELNNRETRIKSSRLQSDVSRIKSNLTAQQIAQIRSEDSDEQRFFGKTKNWLAHYCPAQTSGVTTEPIVDKIQLIEYGSSAQLDKVEKRPSKLRRSKSVRTYSLEIAHEQSPRTKTMPIQNTSAVASSNKLRLDSGSAKADRQKPRCSTSLDLSQQDDKSSSRFSRSKSALSFSVGESPRTPHAMTFRSMARKKSFPFDKIDEERILSFSRPTSRSLISSKSKRSLFSRSLTAPLFSSHNSPYDTSSRKAQTVGSGMNGTFCEAHDEDGGHVSVHEQHEERRQELLEKELTKSAELKNRQTEFTNAISLWVAENTRKDLNNIEYLLQPEHNQEEEKDDVVFPPNEPQEKTPLERWNDLRKIRYLRISDDLADLSGVVTLAKQQKLILPRFAKNQGLTRSATELIQDRT